MDKTMADKLMYIPLMIQKVTLPEDHNYWLKCFETEHTEPTNKNLIEALKVIK